MRLLLTWRYCLIEGPIHVKTVVNATNPTTLNAILERLDNLKYLEILGMTYDIVPGSMEYGGKYKST